MSRVMVQGGGCNSSTFSECRCPGRRSTWQGGATCCRMMSSYTSWPAHCAGSGSRRRRPGWYAGEGTNLSSSFHAYTSFEDLLFAYCWPACPHSLAWCRAALGGCHGWAHRRAVAGGRADGDSFIPAFLLLSLAQHALYRVQLDFECRPQHARTHIECLNRNIKYS